MPIFQEPGHCHTVLRPNLVNLIGNCQAMGFDRNTLQQSRGDRAAIAKLQQSRSKNMFRYSQDGLQQPFHAEFVGNGSCFRDVRPHTL